MIHNNQELIHNISFFRKIRRETKSIQPPRDDVGIGVGVEVGDDVGIGVGVEVGDDVGIGVGVEVGDDGP